MLPELEHPEQYPEFLKYHNSAQRIAWLTLLLGTIWQFVAVPTNWLHSQIMCLYKKGEKSNPANYRSLSIGANLSRLLVCLILKRFNAAFENAIDETQFGFRSNRLTMMASKSCAM